MRKWYVFVVALVMIGAAINAPNMPNTPPGSEGGMIAMAVLGWGCLVWFLGELWLERAKEEDEETT